MESTNGQHPTYFKISNYFEVHEPFPLIPLLVSVIYGPLGGSFLPQLILAHGSLSFFLLLYII